MTNSILLRNVRPLGRNSADILIRDGKIAEISESLVAEGVPIEDGRGRIVLPGLVEAHTHLDKSLWGMGWRPHQAGPSLKDIIETERRLKREWEIDPRRQSERLARLCLSKGSTAIRSHVDVDTEVGLSSIEGVLATKDALADHVDIEIVAFPQSGLMVRPGTLQLMEEAMVAGADVVGGLDPCSMDRDPKGQLDAVFDLAERYGKPIDIHLHEQGELGAFSTELILERTRALGMQGRVTISHCFCLGMPDRARAHDLTEQLAKERISIATAAPSWRPVPAAAELRQAGVTLCAGSDGIRDCWMPHGNGDMIERAMILSLRNNFRTDADLDYALRCCTYGGADVMGLQDYGIDVGCRADLVLVEGETVGEVIVSQPVRKLVLKRGKVVVRDGQTVI